MITDLKGKFGEEGPLRKLCRQLRFEAWGGVGKAAASFPGTTLCSRTAGLRAGLTRDR